MSHFYALLVGINQYAPDSAVPPLRGCVNDVVAMHSILRSLTGAPEDHFHLLTNEDATRDAIITAWRTHLRGRAQPGDVVFFHYSGHGSRARSGDPDSPTGFNESLVAYDSRLEGKFDLLDKELAQLIAEVEEAGAQAILFLDCCHSGGATRSAAASPVRRCSADERPRPPETLLSRTVHVKTRSPSGWSLGGNHVVCAACRAEELANEYFAPDVGRWHGAATYFFLKLLSSSRVDMTWADVQDQLAARVHAIYASQSPQVEGPAHIRLFGGVGPQVGSYLLVTATQEDVRVQVDAGVASGVVEGSRLALYPPGADMRGTPLALAVVEEASINHAWARLSQPRVVEVASRARILSFGYAAPILTVACTELSVREALARSSAGGPSRFVRLVDVAPEDDDWVSSGAELLATLRDGRYVCCDPAGEVILSVDLPAHDTGAALMAQTLEHIAIYRNVRSLRNQAFDPAMRSEVMVTQPVRIRGSRSGRLDSGQSSSIRQVGGEYVAAAGQTIAFQVVSRSERRLYVTVFQLGSDYSILPIAPPKGEGRQVALEPGRSLIVRRKLDPPITGQHLGVVIFKVFVTRDKMSFDSLSLPALNAGPIHLTGQVRDAGPLSSLLDAVRRTGTRPLRLADEEDVDDRWWVEQFEIKVTVP